MGVSMRESRNRPSHVIMPFLGSEIGGSHVAGFTLGEALSCNYGIECIVVCPSPSAIADEARGRQFSVIPSGERPTYRHSLSYDLRRLASRIGILASFRSHDAIIHCNDIQALKSWGPAAKLLGFPLIYHHRSLNPTTFLKRRVFSLADYSICVSNACSENLSCVDRRTVVLDPVGIADGSSRDAARASLVADFGLDGNARLIGFIANFFHRKRPFFFLDVCAHLASQVEGFHGIVFGRERELSEKELRVYADGLGLGRHVTFAGFRLPPSRNVAALDLLLAPALDEPFGLTLVEALLLGVPYVATSSVGHKEIHGRWGGGRMVSDQADSAHFASVALDVLEDPSRVVLDQIRRARARQELSPKRHADDVMRVYELITAPRAALALAVGR